MRPHVAFDVRAHFGKQRFQDLTCGLLMEMVFRICFPATECLFQKVDADAFCPADLVQRGRNPRLALDHLGKQGQPHRDHLAILRQARGDRADKLVLIGGQVGGLERKSCRRPGRISSVL